MDQKRTKGFVIGSSTASKGRIVWKVRVEDPASPHNGQKLVVASIQGGLELAQGLNVDFAVGTVDGPLGTKILRAVDVRLEDPDDVPNINQVKRTGGQ